MTSRREGISLGLYDLEEEEKKKKKKKKKKRKREKRAKGRKRGKTIALPPDRRNSKFPRALPGREFTNG